MVNFAVAAAFLAVVLPPVMPTTHTTCYNYFLEKDGCVNSANDPKIRCEPKPYSGGVPAVSTLPLRSIRSMNDVCRLVLS
jgi:hypothetical protein